MGVVHLVFLHLTSSKQLVYQQLFKDKIKYGFLQYLYYL
jgi:hypothetical protein